MSSDESKKPVAEDIEADSTDPVESMFLSLTQNWKELLIGLVIAGVIFGSVMLYQKKAAANRETAFLQLAVASTGSQFGEIMRQFPKTKAAEMAALMAARAKYDAGNFGEADELYAEFISKHAGHYMIPAAVLGRVHCQEAQGKPDEALAAFRKFIKDYPNETALGTVARLGEARCLRQLGQLQAAVSVYDSLLLEQDKSDWRPLIEDLKSVVVKELERIPVAAAAPAPAAAP